LVELIIWDLITQAVLLRAFPHISRKRPGVGNDTPTYSIKERWQALKWLGDHMDEGPDFGDGPEKGKIYLVDYSKVKSGT
jgi:hypothetical protein